MKILRPSGRAISTIAGFALAFNVMTAGDAEARNPVAPVKNTFGTNYEFTGSPEALSRITSSKLQTVIKSSELARASEMKRLRDGGADGSELCRRGLSCKQSFGANGAGYERILSEALHKAFGVNVKVWENQKMRLRCPTSDRKLVARSEATPGTKTVDQYVRSIKAYTLCK